MPSIRTDKTEAGVETEGDSKRAVGVDPHGLRRAHRPDTIKNVQPANGETLSSANYGPKKGKHTASASLLVLRSVRPDTRRPLENPPT